MTRQSIYLDHNASAPLLPEARAAHIGALDLVGNPSSVHAQGRALRAVIDKARAQVAHLAGAERDQVVFTGSATEAITQAIVGGARAFNVDAIVVSAGEHAAVLKAAEATGLPVKQVGLDADGRSPQPARGFIETIEWRPRPLPVAVEAAPAPEAIHETEEDWPETTAEQLGKLNWSFRLLLLMLAFMLIIVAMK